MAATATKRLRRMFDKLMKDKSAEFDSERDGLRFIQAVLEYEDPVELLYRMTSPRVRLGTHRSQNRLWSCTAAHAEATSNMSFLTMWSGIPANINGNALHTFFAVNRGELYVLKMEIVFFPGILLKVAARWPWSVSIVIWTLLAPWAMWQMHGAFIVSHFNAIPSEIEVGRTEHICHMLKSERLHCTFRRLQWQGLSCMPLVRLWACFSNLAS